MASKSVDLSKFQIERGGVLVCGESGVGKTTLLYSSAAIPEVSPILGISFDNSHDSVVSPHFRRLLADENGVLPDLKMDIKTLASVMDIDEIIRGLRKGDIYYAPTGEPFKTVVLDNLTRFQQRHFAEIHNSAVGGWKPEWPDYMVSQAAITALLTIFTSIDGITTHATVGQKGQKPYKIPMFEADGITPKVDGVGKAMTIQVEQQDAIGFSLDLSPSVANKVPSFFSIVARMHYGKGGVRILDARPNALFRVAKDATGALKCVRNGKELEGVLYGFKDDKGKVYDPTFMEIYECLKQNLPQLS